MTPEESRLCLQRPYPMLLSHPDHGIKLSYDLFEQNILLTEGWREVWAEDAKKRGPK